MMCIGSQMLPQMLPKAALLTLLLLDAAVALVCYQKSGTVSDSPGTAFSCPRLSFPGPRYCIKATQGPNIVRTCDQTNFCDVGISGLP
ncbi:hypothetical protein L596_004603 [Steinernema carpocapsae]|uniref:Uncharacterized protein n=1 Tax=Steinernema carpocapsae TaxID=34508 RepID=A0A4U8V0F5_STECR|nr:hypothetical protein L596_004603 [Steinernema carpocapsae]